ELTQEVNIAVLEAIREQKSMMSARTADEAKAAIQRGDEARANIATALAALDKITTGEGRAQLVGLNAIADRFTKTDDQIRAFYNAGDKEKASDVSSGDGKVVNNDLDSAINTMLSAEKQKMKEADDGADEQFASTRTTMLAAAAVALLIAAVTAYWIANTISKGLARANTVLPGVSEGDLRKTAEVSSHDGIGELLGNVNVMIERLRGVVADALGAADNVSSGSQELSASSEQVSQGATEQAASAEEASASMEQMAA